MSACQRCGAPATHRLPSGFLLCGVDAARVTARLETERARRLPVPLAQPALFEGVA